MSDIYTHYKDLENKLAEAKLKIDDYSHKLTIFHALTILNTQKLTLAVEALEKIASEEYGRPTEMMVIARATLKQLKE